MSNRWQKKKLILFTAGIIAILGFFVFFTKAGVQASSITSGLNQVGQSTDLGTGDLRLTIAKIINIILSLLGIIALVLVIYGGFVYMTAGGDEGKVATAKKILINATIGLAIILSSYALTSFIIGQLEEAIIGGGGPPPADCTDPAYAQNNPQICSGGGFNPCVGNNGQQFVVRSITPSTPNGETGMNNFAARAIFSQGLDSSFTADQVFVIERDNNDVSNEFNFSFIDAPNNSVVEAAAISGNPLDTLTAGSYEVSVNGQLISNGGNQLVTNTNCGSFPTNANFQVNTNGVVDSEAPVVGSIIYNGIIYGGTISLPRGNVYQIGAPVTDNSGVGYAKLEVELQGSSNPIVVYDGPLINRGSQATFIDPYNFVNQWVVPSNAILDEVYDVTLTVYDIDNNSSIQTSQFKIVGSSCEFPTGAGSSSECQGNGVCTQNSDCLSGICDTTTGQCLAVPIITDISPWDGAGGSWVSILGYFFGSENGTVEFGVDDNGNGMPDRWVSAPLAQCSGQDVWHDGWIVVEVPRDESPISGFPNGLKSAIRVSHANGDPQFVDSTTDSKGPIPGPDNGFFTKDNSLSRPGLCALNPSVGPPNTPVTAIGQNFGSGGAGSLVSFGGIQSPISLWSDAQIDTNVPNNMAPSPRVGVAVTVGSESSNGLLFNVISTEQSLAPVIESITPRDTTIGSYITITGQRFGEQTGSAYLCTLGEQIPCNVSLNVSLPDACGDTWTNKQIIAQVPNGTTLSQYNVVVENSENNTISSPSDADQLIVSSGGPMPSICALSPLVGPAPLPDGHAGLNITGINFSNSPMVFFWGRDSVLGDVSTWLSESSVGLSSGSGGVEIINTQIPIDNGYSMQTGPIRARNNQTQLSNSVLYTVSDCREIPVGDIPTGMACCSEGPAAGVLRDENFVCPGQTRSAGYVWRFTTGRIPDLPRVWEECDESVSPPPMPSPSPWRGHSIGNGKNACLNSQITVKFNLPMNPASFAGNIQIYHCGSAAEPDCGGATDVLGTEFSNPSYSNGSPGGAITINDQNSALDSNTWYRVVLLQGIQSLGAIDILGQISYDPRPLLATRPCGSGTAYCFDFKTSATGQVCTLEQVNIIPPFHTTSRLGPVRFPEEVGNLLQYMLWGKGNQSCSVLSVNNLGWEWDTGGVNASNATVSPITEIKATANALANTGPSVPVLIQAELDPAELAAINVSNLPMPIISNLYINLGDPKVVSFWPVIGCADACINGSIGARFNREMDPADYQNGAHLYACPSEGECNENTIGSLTPVLFNVLSIDRTNKDDRLTIRIEPTNDLVPNTWYLVHLDNSIRAVERIDTSNLPIAWGLGLEEIYWKFRTSPDSSACVADKVIVTPNPFIAYFIGEKTRYSSFPYTEPDNCSPVGQELNPWGFVWSWRSLDSTVAEVTDFRSIGHPKNNCTFGCLSSGSNIGDGEVEPNLCGNGTVESGEDCDIGVVGEIPGVSCTLNCLRPGSNAPTCGNGVIEPLQGEECDPNAPSLTNYTQWCSSNCTWTGSSKTSTSDQYAPTCGISSVTTGEDCDIAATGEIEGVTCSSNCLNLGTRIQQAWCDRNLSFQANSECQIAVSICGNGLVEAGEECEINVNGNTINVFNPSAPGTVGTPTNALATSCDKSCLLQDICVVNNIPSSFKCDPATEEGCYDDCTLQGSSIERYTNASLCGDSVVGTGEYAWCEYTLAEVITASILDENPIQAVTAIGAGNVVGGAQQTEIQSTLTGMRGENALLAPTDQRAGQGDYTLQCGFTENDTIVAPYNDCPNAGDGVGNNSCCYPRTMRVSEYPLDTAGLGGGDAVCRNTYISVTFDGDIDESTLSNNLLIARGLNTGEVSGVILQDDVYLAPFTNISGVTQVLGALGDAYSFDGAYSHLVSELPWNDASGKYDFSSSDYSIEFWLKTNSIQRDMIAIEGNGSRRWYLNINQTPGKVSMSLQNGADYIIVNSISNVNDNNWHYVAVVLDRQDLLDIYIDGQLDTGVVTGSIGGVSISSNNISNPVFSDLDIVGSGSEGLNLVIGRWGDPTLTPASAFAFSGLLDEFKITKRVLTLAEIKANFNAREEAACVTIGHTTDVTDLVNNTLAYAEVDLSNLNIWQRIWFGVKQFFARLFGMAQASQYSTDKDLWCTGRISTTPQFSRLYNTDGNVAETKVSLYIDELLEANATYGVFLRGGKNGIKDVSGVGIGNPDNSVILDDSFVFKTGNEVCTIESIAVDPASYVYTAPNTPTDFIAEVTATNDQLIVPIPNVYDWGWSWVPQGDAVFDIPTQNTPSNAAAISISSTELEGSRTASARATVTISPTVAEIGTVYSGNTNLTSLFCENSWPPVVDDEGEVINYYPYEDGISYGKTKNQDGTDGLGNFNGTDVPIGANYFNFQMGYCADAGQVANKADDLPYLKPFVFTTDAQLVDVEVLKKFLFFNDLNDDVVGVQIFENLERKTVSQWYNDRFGDFINSTPSQNLRSIQLAGYEGLTDGSNYYINALNQSGENIYNNIYLFSINQDAQTNTRQVFDKLIDSIEFNINLSDVGYCFASGAIVPTDPADNNWNNISDPSVACNTDFDCLDAQGSPLSDSAGQCSNAKTKMLRDWDRLHRVQDAQNKIAYYGGGAPSLQSGTYIPGQTNSRWPSWGRLSSIVGGLNLDPINTWSSCNYCSDTSNGVIWCSQDSDCTGDDNKCVFTDSQTCWDDKNSQFICPTVASVFEYEYDEAASDYTLHAPLEYFSVGSNVVQEFVDTTHYSSSRACSPAGIQSPTSGDCGNYILNNGEECDPPGERVLGSRGFVTSYASLGECDYEILTQPCSVSTECPTSHFGETIIPLLSGPTYNPLGVEVQVDASYDKFVCQFDNTVMYGVGKIVTRTDGKKETIPLICNPDSDLSKLKTIDCSGGIEDQGNGEDRIYSLINNKGYTDLSNTTDLTNRLTCKQLGDADYLFRDSYVSCSGVGQMNVIEGDCPVNTKALAVCSNQCDWQYGACLAQTECGNGRIESGEECDHGFLNSDIYGSCTTSCQRATNKYCGDEIKDDIYEACDVKLATYQNKGFCEDTRVPCSSNGGCNTGKTCLAYNDVSYSLFPNQSCASDCQSLGGYCGDGVLNNLYEECDDSNNTNGDGCSSVCLEEAPTQQTPSTPSLGSCGDGVKDAGEDCDLGAQNGIKCTPIYGQGCNYCSYDCSEVLYVDPIAYCGNNRVDSPPEVCDIVNNLVVTQTDNNANCSDIITSVSEEGNKVVGSVQCANQCTSLTNSCVECGLKNVSDGGAVPRIAVLNPMTANNNNDTSNWYNETFVRFRENMLNFSGANLESIYSQQNNLYDDPNTGIESILQCNGVYKIEFDNEEFSGDSFDYPVNGEYFTVNNEYVVSPAVPPGAIRVVTHWTNEENQISNGVNFVSSVYSAGGTNSYTGTSYDNYTDRLRIEIDGSPAHNLCYNMEKDSNEYWQPTIGNNLDTVDDDDTTSGFGGGDFTNNIVWNNTKLEMTNTGANYNSLNEAWAPRNSNLVGYWKMDNNSIDTAGGDNDATAQNGVLFSSDAKLGSHAALFDGVDDYFSVANNNNLNRTTGFSIAAWIYPRKADGFIVAKRTSFSSSYPYLLYFDPNRKISLISGSGSDNRHTSNQTIPLNEWTHVMVSVNSIGNYSIYINGQEDKNGSFTSGNMNAEELYIGRQGPGSYFSGMIDELAIWNTAFSSSEIEDIYDHQSDNFKQAIFTSRVMGLGFLTDWTSLGWEPVAPYGKNLPDNQGVETGYADGNADMSGNVLLLHLNETTGNIVDYSRLSPPSNNSITTNNRTPVTSGPRGFLRALKFNGIDQNMVVTMPNGLPRNPSTYEMWASWDGRDGAPYQRDMLFVAGPIGTGPSLYFYDYVVDGLAEIYWNTWDNGDNPFRVFDGNSSAQVINYGGPPVTVPENADDGNLHHYVVMVGGDSVDLYYDGKLLGKAISTRNPSGNILYIGGVVDSNNLKSYWPGRIDEVAVYNRLLSSQEILDHYKRGVLDLNFQVRSCASSTCSGGEAWQGLLSEFENNTNSLPDVSLASFDDNKYFQYKTTFISRDPNYSPYLKKVAVQMNPLEIKRTCYGGFFTGSGDKFKDLTGGVFMHDIGSLSETFIQSFTMKLGNINGVFLNNGPYAVFVQALTSNAIPIYNFRNSNLIMEIYKDHQDQFSQSVYKPVEVFTIKDAANTSSNPLARYWHVFNVLKDGSIQPVDEIQTGLQEVLVGLYCQEPTYSDVNVTKPFNLVCP